MQDDVTGTAVLRYGRISTIFLKLRWVEYSSLVYAMRLNTTRPRGSNKLKRAKKIRRDNSCSKMNVFYCSTVQNEMARERGSYIIVYCGSILLLPLLFYLISMLP